MLINEVEEEKQSQTMLNSGWFAISMAYYVLGTKSIKPSKPNRNFEIEDFPYAFYGNISIFDCRKQLINVCIIRKSQYWGKSTALE